MDKHQISEYLKKCQDLQTNIRKPISVSTYFDENNESFLVVSANINDKYIFFRCYKFDEEDDVKKSFEDFVKAISE